MQPEQPYFAHHPGRFVYMKDEESDEFFSAPYEPVRSRLDSFEFSVGKSDIQWTIRKNDIIVNMCLSLTVENVVELWSIKVRNASFEKRRLSLYPYFPVGYMSWMNQSGEYREDLNAIVCSSVTPYQKYQDYFKNKNFKDKTFLIADVSPTSWDVRQAAFEGEGGLHAPSGIQAPTLSNSDARYETPACIFHYHIDMAADEEREFRFLFGPALDDSEIRQMRNRYFGDNGESFEQAKKEYQHYIDQGRGCLEIHTPDKALDDFVNNWLPRQIFYHGDTNRLTTDPQTRNYLQDSMGMSYIDPQVARQAFLLALSQQKRSGAMPDGILLRKDAELKYINQVPHTDHCVWLPICLRTYLDETNDYAILDERIAFADDELTATVSEHIDLAMHWLVSNRDSRGLSYIAQGDWCDPMNMVGYKDKGVSAWLSLAVAYALNEWADICRQSGYDSLARDFRASADEFNAAVNEYLWDGEWYARGITDDNVVFGVSKDKEGRIFLNPQGWAMLSGAADESKRQSILKSVDALLATPYGVTLLAPAFTKMREDVGRVTQKHPGSAENGSVYNHAAAFYIYGLYSIEEYDRAFTALRQMIPGPENDDYTQRGQLPVFIPNYYRGAYYQFPRTAGRSSQLFNTGTVHWFYRCLLDGLFGVRGDSKDLRLEPQLPSHWQKASIVRTFRGATFNIDIQRRSNISVTQVTVDGVRLDRPIIEKIDKGVTYQVHIALAG
jgi:cellobionic acid phosphorylase